MHFAVILFFILLAPVLSGAYGAIYDMIVFTFAPDFFTEYRFAQFELSGKMTPIIGAGIIGFTNSWKVGIPVGIILGGLCYMHKDIQKTFRYMMVSYGIVILTTIIASTFALLLMRNQLSENIYLGTDQGLKETVEIIINMNNFAYSGALIGTACACVWQVSIILRKTEKKIKL